MINLTKKQKNIVVGVTLSATALYISFVITKRAIVRKKLNAKLIDTNINFVDVFNKSKWPNLTPTLSDPKLRQMAQAIYNSIGVFTDDRTAALQQIQLLNSKGDASLLAYVYDNLYKRSLAQDLEKMFKDYSSDMALLGGKLNSLN